MGSTAVAPLASPTRLIDSRTGVGKQQAPLNADASRAVQITGSTVPSSATAWLIDPTGYFVGASAT